MSKARKKRGNPDFRHRVTPPAPPTEAIESRLFELISPGTFTNLKTIKDKDRSLRSRVLTLPVMAAIVLSLVYRQVQHLTDVLRLLETEGLLWVERLKVSRQAVSQRLNSLPASLFAELFEQVVERLGQQPCSPQLPPPWASVVEHFGAVWVPDGSTLEAVRKHFGQLSGQTLAVLAGKVMMVVEAFTHRPVAGWYESNPNTNETHWWERLAERLPVGGLLVVDMGFYGFVWVDLLTESGKFVVTRQKQKVRSTTLRLLSQGRYYQERIIQLGLYSSDPCRHPMRLVSVQWGTSWYHYLTNVLDPQHLSAQQVCELYRQRWCIEDAFKLTKRVLGLSYLWVGSANGVQLQLDATWIFYAVLSDLVADVAIAMAQPLERVSVEMVFRSLYFFNRVRERDPEVQLIPWVVEHQQSMGLLKAVRKRHRSIKACSLDIWQDALT